MECRASQLETKTLQILSLLRSPKGRGDYIEQLNVSPNSQHKLAGIPSSPVQSASVDKLLKRLIPSQLKRKCRIVRVEYPKHQRHLGTIRTTPEISADLEDEATAQIFMPAIATALECMYRAKLINERKDVPLLSCPTCRLNS